MLDHMIRQFILKHALSYDIEIPSKHTIIYDIGLHSTFFHNICNIIFETYIKWWVKFSKYHITSCDEATV